MINPFRDVDWNPSRDKRRAFGLSLMIGFPIIALVLLAAGYVRGYGWNIPLAIGIGGGGALAGAVFRLFPGIARPFYLAWYFVACCIGIVVANVFMATVFYVFVAGLGLVMRAVGRKAFTKTVDRAASTYWLDAGPRPDRARYFRQY
jgi:hypothetical protein